MFNQSTRQDSQAVDSQETVSGPQQDVEPVFVDSVPSELGVADSQATGDSSDFQVKYQQLQDQFTRLAADFDNYRKRTREEQESLVKYGAQKTILELLPVLDNLDRATGSLTEDSDPKLLFKSFGMMQRQLLDGLENIGVKKIATVGHSFDPALHEAVSQMPSDEIPEDAVLQEVQSGYQLHDKVIRPALVIVSTGSSSEAAAGTSTDQGASAQTVVEEPHQKPVNPFAQA